MTGLDTNVVVRFFVNDDPVQFQRAGTLLASFTSQSLGFITLICLVEWVWVLRSQYRVSKLIILEWLERLLEASELAIENQAAVEEATRRFASGKSDFADYLIEIVGRSAGCRETVTFDMKASRSAGMKLL